MAGRVDVAVGVIIKDSKVLIAERAKHLHQGNKWEFPGGKVESDESVESALKRELNEELGIEIQQQRSWFSLSFDYPDKQVNLHMWIVSEFAGQPEGKEGQPIRWVAFEDLGEYTFPDANVPIIQKLQSHDF
jgi:8-oxo-dGTP diphosphatase